ncbi:MAG: zinc-ribbon domain-containing protein [Deltaproteobacteria bacterium]
MSKQEIIKVITGKFAKMGISYQTGTNTDIAITAEFLDAGWSTGKKTINYESSIFVDEASQTIFMWELTKEVGSGFSFGGDSESSFQSGTTLFRKVKSVQYGLDGKAFEINLDLGAIPKAVKETAKQYGWKFKTVLKREKALWPAGYVQSQGREVQMTNNEALQQAAVPSNSFCTNCGNKLSAAAVFCPECGTQQREDMQQQTFNKPQEQVLIQPPPITVNTNAAPIFNQAVSSQPIKAGKTSVMFWILFILLALFDLMAAKLCGVVFIVLSIIILMILFKNRKSISKGFFKTLFWFIAAFIITTAVYIITFVILAFVART